MDPSIWKRYLNRKQNTYTHIELLSMFFPTCIYIINLVLLHYFHQRSFSPTTCINWSRTLQTKHDELPTTSFQWHFCITFSSVICRTTKLECSIYLAQQHSKKNNKRPIGHIATLRNSSNLKAQLQKVIIKLIKKKTHYLLLTYWMVLWIPFSKFNWNWPSGSGEEDFWYCQCIFPFSL